MAKLDELVTTAHALRQSYKQNDTTPLGFADIAVAYECVVKCIKEDVKDLEDKLSD